MSVENIWIRVVAAAIIRNGNVLIARRSCEMNCPREWEFPGGKIEGSESDSEGLIREIREELNISITPGEYIGYAVNGVYRIYLYLVEQFDGEPEVIEHDAIKWLPFEKLSGHSLAAADQNLAEQLCVFFKKRGFLPCD